MTVDTDNFDKAGEFGPVTKFERTVRTPMVERSDARYTSGYYFEENRMVCYEVGDHQFKVSKVGDKGWTVTHYKNDELEAVDREYRDEEGAHEYARELVEEVAADE